MIIFDLRWITFPITAVAAMVIGDVSGWVVFLVAVACFPIIIKV